MDLRRRNDFASKPSWFLRECEALGLFQTRMPRFPQLFFYNCSEAEVIGKQGQAPLGPSAMQWSSMGWLASHPRLESKSGVSDVLYQQLEKIYGARTRAASAHPHLDPGYLWIFTRRFQWTDLDKEEMRVRNKREEDFWLETGEGRRENRPQSSLTRRLTSAAAMEDGSDYIPSSVPEEQELRVRK
jgi:hypothetical protein